MQNERKIIKEKTSMTPNYRTISFLLPMIALCVVGELYIPISIIPLFIEKFRVSAADATWLISAFGFAYAIGFLMSGPLSDRFGRKVILTYGLLLLSLATCLVALSVTFKMLVMARIIQGLIASTFAPTALAYVHENFPDHLKGLIITLITTGFMLAGIVGQLYAQTIVHYFQWNAIFYILALVYFIFFICSKAILVEITVAKQNSVKFLSVYRSMLSHLRNVNLITAYLLSFFLLFTFVAMYTGLGPYLVKMFELNQEQLFWVRAAGGLGALIAPLFGRFIRGRGMYKVIFFGVILMMLGLVFVGIMHNMVLIVISTIFVVLGIAVTTPAIITYVGTCTQTSRGSAIALYTFILFAGASTGPLAASKMSNLPYTYLILTLISCLLLSLTLFFIASSPVVEAEKC